MKFKRQNMPDGTVQVVRDEGGDMSYVGRGESPESAIDLMRALGIHGEVEDDGSGGEGQDRTAGGFVP